MLKAYQFKRGSVTVCDSTENGYYYFSDPIRYINVETDSVEIVPFDHLDPKHAQAALDAWYTDVVPIKLLIPDFKKWLITHMPIDQAEKVINLIKWH